uniref:Uncharacterized protein n=1 Tax=Strongyloides papillosus TaxID=174720 RepID=A0A0N5B8K4_STREA
MKSIVRSLSQRSPNLLHTQYGHKRLVNVVENNEDFIIIRKVNSGSNFFLKERFENFSNFLKEKIYEFLQLNEICLVKLVIYLLTIWVSAAVIIYLFESPEDIIYKKEQKNKQMLNVLKMIDKLEKIQSYKFYDNVEWEKAVVKLLIDEEHKVYGYQKDNT